MWIYSKRKEIKRFFKEQVAILFYRVSNAFQPDDVNEGIGLGLEASRSQRASFWTFLFGYGFGMILLRRNSAPQAHQGQWRDVFTRCLADDVNEGISLGSRRVSFWTFFCG